MQQCIHCGAQMAPGSAQCPNCGAQVAMQPQVPGGAPAAPYAPTQAAPPQAAPYPPPAGAGYYGAAPGNPYAQPPGAAMMGPPPGPVPPFIGWAIAALLQSVMCGFVFTGVPAAILAFIGKSEWDQGITDRALGKLKAAKILTIIGFALIGLGGVAYVLLMAFGIAAGAMSSTSGY